MCNSSFQKCLIKDKKDTYFVKYMSFEILENNKEFNLLLNILYTFSPLFFSKCLLIANVSNLNPSSGRISQSVFNILIQPTEKISSCEWDKWTPPINEPRAIILRFLFHFGSRLSLNIYFLNYYTNMGYKVIASFWTTAVP